MLATSTFTHEQFNTFINSLQYPPNHFQLQVLDSVAFGNGNIIVDAKAGSGKTSLLKMIAQLLRVMGVNPSDILFQAFNKGIEVELNEQLPTGFKAKTSHALGRAMAVEYAKSKNVHVGRISSKKYRKISESIAKRLYPDADDNGPRFMAMIKIQNLIAKIMANNINPSDRDAIIDLAEHYGISDVTPAMLNHLPDAIHEAITRFEKFGEMDFIDMIYLPVKLNLQPKKKYKWVLVDECQDLNSLQQEISTKMLHPEGRIILVGDPSQAIYGFSGADAESFANLQHKFNAEKLELNICYRCPTSHIKLAQSLVPTIEAAPNASLGTIKYEHLNNITKMNPSSMVICRLNAPLVSTYFQFITAEKPAVIIGRSMGKNLIRIIDEAASVSRFRYADMGKHLNDYFEREKERLIKKPNSESKISELTDSVNCLQVCLSNFDCEDLDCFKQKLDTLFVDTTDKEYDPKQVVTLCTVHGAKGLEADEIGIIYQRMGKSGWQNIMPLSWENQREWEKEQELNIIYVAFTRAKKNLHIFGGYTEDNQPNLISDIENFADDAPLLTIETIDPDTGEVDEKAPTIRLNETTFAQLVNSLPPRKPDISELVQIRDGHKDLLGLMQKAIAIALKLKEANIWDGETIIRFDDAHTAHQRLMVNKDLSLESLILAETDGVIMVKLPSEQTEIPIAPQAWAQYVMTHKDQFVILDTETTDLPQNVDNFEIVQLSIIDMDGNTLFNEYIKPRRATITPGAARIHGITDAKIAFASYLGMEWDKIEPHLKGKHIIAYNSPFDKKALQNSLELNHSIYASKLDCVEDWHCAMQMYKKHNPAKKDKRSRTTNWKLTEAVEQEGIVPDPNAHDALADVLMTLQLIKAMAVTPDEESAMETTSEQAETVADTNSEQAQSQKPTIEKSAPNAPKQDDPYKRLETLIRSTGSPDKAQEMVDLFQEMIDLWKTELA